MEGVKRCSVCHCDLPRRTFSKRKASKDGLRASCRQCAAKEFKKWCGTNHLKAFVKSIRGCARKRGVSCSITTDNIRDRYETLTCEMTGLPLQPYITPYPGSTRNPFAVSPDRIVPGSEYSPESIRLVSQGLNIALNEWGPDATEQIMVPFLRSRGYRVERLTSPE
jgi:hypothetical protein